MVDYEGLRCLLTSLFVDANDCDVMFQLIPPGERSFDFMESEVRAQLGHLSQDMTRDILHILRGYEPTVFETRTIPRLAPHRDLDLAIAKTSGARPVASRPYPVAP